MNIKIKLTRKENYNYFGVAANSVITIDIEEYLRGVVPSEMNASWNENALKAQAITSRSYALYQSSKTINDTTSYQAYHVNKIDSRTDAVIAATAGKVLTYNNQVIDAVFSASNGGRCVSAKEQWGGNGFPYLVAKDDPWTAASGYAKNGHGVGMSQRGAWYAAGWFEKTYTEILAFYYPGTTLVDNYNTGGSSSQNNLIGKTGTVVVNSAGLNVRNAPGGSALSYKLYNGEQVTILEVGNADGYTWYRVKDSQNRTNGWVRSDFISLNSSSSYANWQAKYGNNTFVNSNSYSGNVYRFQVDLNKWLRANNKSTIVEDGKWGNASSTATLTFQKAYSELTNDGKAGPATKAKLFSLYG